LTCSSDYELPSLFADDITINDTPIILPQTIPLVPEVPATGMYVRIHHHPSSGLPDEIITLDQYLQTRAAQFPLDHKHLAKESDAGLKLYQKPPWYPFKTAEDFDFAEFAHKCRFSNTDIDEHLRRLKNVWCTGVESKISFNTHGDINSMMEAMRETGVKVSSPLTYPMFASVEYFGQSVYNKN
jgi:hypothetical protein